MYKVLGINDIKELLKDFSVAEKILNSSKDPQNIQEFITLAKRVGVSVDDIYKKIININTNTNDSENKDPTTIFNRIIRMLIAAGVDIPVNDNEAIILWASKNGHLEIVRLLIDLGVDVTAKDNYAIRLASENGHLEVVRLLLANGADCTENDNEAIRLASENGHLEVVQLLLENNNESMNNQNDLINSYQLLVENIKQSSDVARNNYEKPKCSQILQGYLPSNEECNYSYKNLIIYNPSINKDWTKLNDGRLEYVLDVPGLDSKSIVVTAKLYNSNDYKITINGSKKISESCTRSIGFETFVSDIDIDSISVVIKDGVLIITANKAKLKPSVVKLEIK